MVIDVETEIFDERGWEGSKNRKRIHLVTIMREETNGIELTVTSPYFTTKRCELFADLVVHFLMDMHLVLSAFKVNVI